MFRILAGLTVPAFAVPVLAGLALAGPAMAEEPLWMPDPAGGTSIMLADCADCASAQARLVLACVPGGVRIAPAASLPATGVSCPAAVEILFRVDSDSFPRLGTASFDEASSLCAVETVVRPTDPLVYALRRGRALVAAPAGGAALETPLGGSNQAIAGLLAECG
ncbi:hypothetical protein [Chachezhania sediminis]|uniref:hypothetical protein n=1 Tax=Chachezhania sediminis TaxID=2599291 RepID=UPI00131C4E79|nr:hypothetical protein [Chachezhania sediminis]